MAILRVKTFNGLLFESIFDFSIFLTSLISMIFDKRVDTKKKT